MQVVLQENYIAGRERLAESVEADIGGHARRTLGAGGQFNQYRAVALALASVELLDGKFLFLVMLRETLVDERIELSVEGLGLLRLAGAPQGCGQTLP